MSTSNWTVLFLGPTFSVDTTITNSAAQSAKLVPDGFSSEIGLQSDSVRIPTGAKVLAVSTAVAGTKSVPLSAAYL